MGRMGDTKPEVWEEVRTWAKIDLIRVHSASALTDVWECGEWEGKDTEWYVGNADVWGLK